MHSGFIRTAAAFLLAAVLLTTTAAYAQSSGFINANCVCFRSGPSTGCSVIGTYNSGKELIILSEQNGWTNCLIDGSIGYVYSLYVSQGQTSSGSKSPAVVLEEPAKKNVQDISNPLWPLPTPVSAQGTQQKGPSAMPSVVITPSPKQTPAPVLPTAVQVTVQPQQTETVTDTTGIAGVISGDYVRFRTGPSTSYSIITMYNKGKTVSVLGQSGNWTKCVIDGKTGFVSSQYIKQQTQSTPVPPVQTPQLTVTVSEETTVLPTPVQTETSSPEKTDIPEQTTAPATQGIEGYITGNNVRFRNGPSLSADIIGEFYFANTVEITGTAGEWTAVRANGKEGYVYSAYVKQGRYAYSTPSRDGETGQTDVTEPAPAGKVTGRDIVSYAMNFVGYKYSWGGKAPETGFDCSGLVYYVYQHFGITLNRVAADQARNGSHVDPANLQAGDILCFYSGGDYIGHAGIYIGDGKFIHAATSTTGVIITELSGYYSSRGYEARRIVG